MTGEYKIMSNNKKSVEETQDYREKFTVDQVADALRKAAGNQSAAAKMLKTNRSTIHGYVERYPQLRQVIAEAKEETLDLAEDQLIQKIRQGNMAAIIFFLKTQGKSRGFVEKGEVKIETQRPDFSQMSTEQLEQLYAQLDSKSNGRSARLHS